jgi:uncharacterized protein YbaR (Trm112 family)
MSLFEIKCPLCKGTLWIDQSTGKVVDHKSVDHQKADFDGFLQARKNRNPQWEDKFKKVQAEKAKRKAEIEEKFKMAKENPDELKGEMDSPFKWD